LSWTFEKDGSELDWRLKCRPATDSKKLTVGILDFLVDANIRLNVYVTVIRFQRLGTHCK
ncbi:hypothetical protein CISIN_1g0405522mg, partial [Citrus sinensis]